MKYLKYALLGLLLIVLVTIALANSTPVTLRLLPEELAGFMGFAWEITLPLFVVVFLGLAGGLLLGFFVEWFREHKFRAEARRERREKERLAQEVTRLKQPGPNRGDDVLALLEDGSVPR